MYRHGPAGLEVLLVHPGGPYWQRKDAGAWSIPKGEYEAGEAPEAVARREFAEELGTPLRGTLHALGSVRQRGGKEVAAFAVEGDLDVTQIASNRVQIEWPPRSGRRQSFPEIDRAAWLGLAQAREKINPAQADFLDRLESFASRR